MSRPWQWIVFTLACTPGPITVDSGGSSSESSTSVGATDSSSADGSSTDGTTTDDATDTGDPLPPPTSTCEASVFALDNTYQQLVGYSVPIVVREDGSVVAAYMIDVLPDFTTDVHMHAWNVDGSEIWNEVFLSPGDDWPKAAPTLAADELGDIYLGHGVANSSFPASITKFFGADGAQLWTYQAGIPGGSDQRVVDMHVDAGGRLLAAMTLNFGWSDSNIVVAGLDPDSGMEVGWGAEWDGPEDLRYSYDHAGGLAIDPESGRVFAAGNDNDTHDLVVVAWDPPSTTPTWVARPIDPDGWIVGLELTAAGRLVVLDRHSMDGSYNDPAPWMFVLNPDDGELIWWGDSADLGFEPNAVVEPVDMVATPDGGVALSGYIPDPNLIGVSKGFLLRLDADLQPYCLDVASFPGLTDPNILTEIDVAPNGQLYAGGWMYRASAQGGFEYRKLVARWD